MIHLRHISAACFVLLAACGESMGPQTQTPTFPDIDQAVLTAYCIRGTAGVPAIRGGNLSTIDCPTENTLVGSSTGEGYWEGWRVRVSSSEVVTFRVDSDFDSFLDLFQIELANPALVNLVTFDDDSGENGNAELTVTLQPDREYWVLVSGYAAVDVGTYTLNIN